MTPASDTPGAGGAVLEGRGIVKRYGGVTAVAEVSFQVMAGEVLGIAGPNGAGKTTLFDVITGHTPASAGSVLLAGTAMDDATVYERCRVGVARTFQQPTIASSLTVLENVYLAASYRRGREGGRSADLAAARENLAIVGLAGSELRTAGLLPVYDRKRLMLATALATNPLVLLLDEPFGGLNPKEIDETVELVRRVRGSGVAVICIEHVMRALVALADRVLVLHHGAELFHGAPQAMLRDQRVIDVYLGSQARVAS